MHEEIKTRIVMTIEAFNRKISLFTNKLNIELKKELSVCSKTWTLRKLERIFFESLEILCLKRKKKIKWSEKVTNEEFLGRIGEKRAFLNNILRIKVIMSGLTLRRNCTPPICRAYARKSHFTSGCTITFVQIYLYLLFQSRA